MKYNGKELVEMTREDWDGKFRRMLVWNDNDTSCHLSYVVGYSYIEARRNGFIEYESVWCSNDAAEYGPTMCVETWQHCAEIPDDEKFETNEESYITNNMTSDEIIEKFKTLRTELKQWLKNQDPNNLLVNNLQYGIKTALNLTDVNKHLSEAVDFSNVDTNVKKPRRMTNRELAKWIGAGNGEYKNGEYAYSDYVYETVNYNQPVEPTIMIRAWNEDTWHEPMIEE